MDSNVDDVVKYIEQYKMSLKSGVENGIKQVTKMAYEILQNYCSEQNLTNHLDNITMDYDPINNVGSLSTTDMVIIFKEMGTGIVGSNNPHPNPNFADWTYCSNPERNYEMGWRYPKEDGTYGWTSGLPAGSMFYNTFNDIKKYVDNTMQIEIHKETGNLY